MADTPLGEPGQYACQECGEGFPSTEAALACCPDHEDTPEHY